MTLIKRLIAFLVLCLWSTLASAAVVQSGENSATASTTTVALTGVGNGNYLVAFAVSENDTGSITFSTSAGTTSAWTQVVNQTEGGDFAVIGAAYATKTTSTGNVTVQMTGPGSSWNAMIVVEVDSIAAYDSAVYTRDTANPMETTAGTPGAYDAMLIGFALDWGAATPTVTSGWTDIITGMTYGATAIGRAEYRVYSSGTAQASFSASGGDPTFVVHVILQESGGGGGGVLDIFTMQSPESGVGAHKSQQLGGVLEQ